MSYSTVSDASDVDPLGADTDRTLIVTDTSGVGWKLEGKIVGVRIGSCGKLPKGQQHQHCTQPCHRSNVHLRSDSFSHIILFDRK